MIFLIFILGLIIGSFLNVVIYRLPKKESIVYPASHCPNCDHELSALELIPIFSYIFLRGKCKNCGKKFRSDILLSKCLLELYLFSIIYTWLI